MKKKYVKPDLLKESMALQTKAVRTCSDAEDYWSYIKMPDDNNNVIVLAVPQMGCDMTEHEYMDLYGGDDGACLYASTDDGVVFNS